MLAPRPSSQKFLNDAMCGTCACKCRCPTRGRAARVSRMLTCTSAVCQALWPSSSLNRSSRLVERSSALASFTTIRLVRSQLHVYLGQGICSIPATGLVRSCIGLWLKHNGPEDGTLSAPSFRPPSVPSSFQMTNNERPSRWLTVCYRIPLPIRINEDYSG